MPGLDEIANLPNAGPDLYQGRLREIRVPVAIVHGQCDPRTEPGELDEIRRELPAAQVHIIPGAEHSPHSSRTSQEECARVVAGIVEGLNPKLIRSKLEAYQGEKKAEEKTKDKAKEKKAPEKKPAPAAQPAAAKS